MKKRVTTAQPKFMSGYRSVGTQIRFGGKWLKELGFKPKQKLEITFQDNELRIKQID